MRVVQQITPQIVQVLLGVMVPVQFPTVHIGHEVVSLDIGSVQVDKRGVILRIEDDISRSVLQLLKVQCILYEKHCAIRLYVVVFGFVCPCDVDTKKYHRPYDRQCKQSVSDYVQYFTFHGSKSLSFYNLYVDTNLFQGVVLFLRDLLCLAKDSHDVFLLEGFVLLDKPLLRKAV